MKNKTLLLAKVLLKNEGFRLKPKNKRGWFILVLMLFAFAPLFILKLEILSRMYSAFGSIGQEGVIISWGLVVNSLAIFIYGIFYVVSVFYFTTDVEFYLPLPIRPRQIVGAKFLVMVLYEYLITAYLYLPNMVYYGIRQGAGLLYYVSGLVIMVLVPIVPLALATLLVMLIMRVTNLSRYREQLKMIGGILGVFIGIGFSIVLQMFINVSQNDLLQMLQQGNNSLSLVVTRIFPTVRWASQALLDDTLASRLLNLGVFIGVSVIVYIIVLLFAEMLYFKGVIGVSESRSHRRRLEESSIAKLVKQRSAFKSYLITEIKLLLRTPAYFINCVLVNFMWPIFIILPLLVNPEINLQSEALAELSAYFHNPETAGIALGVILAFLVFAGGSNGITSTAISREGPGLYVKKYIPISYRDQIFAKLLSGIIFGYAGVVVIAIPIIVFFKVPVYFTIVLFILGLLAIALPCMCGLLFDLINPKLEWDSEQKAVKQNFNAMYSMFISIAAAALLVILSFILKPIFYLAVIMDIAILGVLCVLGYWLLYTQGVKLFSELEE